MTMSTISNLNIVLQQEGGAREAQNVRQGANSQNHVVAENQKEKDIQQQTTVQESDQAERTKPEKELTEKRKRKRKKPRSTRQSDADSDRDRKRGPGEAGKLVNTVA